MKECLKGPLLSDPGIFNDSYLLPYHGIIEGRLAYIQNREQCLTQNHQLKLIEFCDYHLIFGLHLVDQEWIFREWAPNAVSIHIIGDATQWQVKNGFSLENKDTTGVWEGRFSRNTFHHGDLYRLKIAWPNGLGDRIPTAAVRVVQDPHTLIFNAQVWNPPKPYVWKQSDFLPADDPPLIYEAHVGMALEAGRVGSYLEFEQEVLPRIKQAGYNTIQLMAIPEHPYYGSIGYHVSSFYAPSSRFGTPEELKSLVDKAHALGIRVIMDIVHSHAAGNEVEGLARFDGTSEQFFYPGDRGRHTLWDSCCFDYGKPMVVKFLLSNLKYWLDLYKIDGFRFDGVTSMLYKDHGINRAFTSYDDYFNDDLDSDALAFLFFANKLIHECAPHAVTIAEDVSGYPGMAAPALSGGIGFDYRFAMGIADFWIKLLKGYRDENWPLGKLWAELNAGRREERCISYAESHDQALVGDQTIMMRLMGEKIYDAMEAGPNLPVTTFRGVALHKMIRLITLTTAKGGYLNFMGNEFGHPDWIEFPSLENNWSYHYARRQWSLMDNESLLFFPMAGFDRAMVRLIKKHMILDAKPATLLHLHQADQVLAFERNGLVFVFNFHPADSFTDYRFPAAPGKYKMVLDSDSKRFAGKGRLQKEKVHFTLYDKGMKKSEPRLSLYIPTRTAFVLARTE